MTIYLSENIKKFRQKKNVTQEKLADFLGITFQSVSNWERGETYPDISLLPDIASFFKVSVDELLGINKSEAEKLINNYLSLYDAMRYKDTNMVYLKFKEAVKQFPSDFRLLIRYMELLMCETKPENSIEYEKVSQELLSLFENIQAYCNDDSIRMWSKRLICQHLHTKAHYMEKNEYQLQAERILEEMPEMIDTKDYLSTMLITDFEKHQRACADMIENCLYLFDNTVTHQCVYDENYSSEYKINAIIKCINVNDIIFTDKNYGKLWLNMIYNYGHLSYLYFDIGDTDNAIKYLELCVNEAIRYDTLPENSKRKAQFFEGSTFEKTLRGKTMCQRMKYLITEKYPFTDEFVRSEKFKEILAKLDND